MTYRYEWGLSYWEEADEDRREFVQNTRTYKRLNDITQKEDYYPDPLWRGIALLVGFVGVTVVIGVNVGLILIIEVSKGRLAEIIAEYTGLES